MLGTPDPAMCQKSFEFNGNYCFLTFPNIGAVLYGVAIFSYSYKFNSCHTEYSQVSAIVLVY